MNFIGLLLSFVFFSIIDYFLIRHEIKQNIDLFYALHQHEVIRVLNKSKKDDHK